ncbi:glycosyltransferase [Enterobacter hormaechei]|uniref:glycosyltransferase n=1 Tax=Enterobacter sp. TaxID=42895 RepID=UPI002586EB52|nr:glycosyltransferase [Enterobacter sp.]EKS6644839.1 glycosyltransferase [Enterobacter hormaechei]MBS6388220.1 glycosyltransferase [Enterobacter sp.]
MKKFLTIITSTFNVGNEFNLTASSIREQLNEKCQWIVIDADSKQSTKKIIESNMDVIDVFISEKDDGIYDAWNKACKYIQGEWVIFFGSGDGFYSNNTVSELKSILNSKSKVYYGKVNIIDENKKIICQRGEVPNIGWHKGKPSMPCHQGVIQHSSLFCGDKTFDTRYKIAGDTHFLMSSGHLGNISFINKIISNMLEQGISGRPDSKLIIYREAQMLEQDFNLQTNFFDGVCYKFRIYFFFYLMKITPTTLYSFMAKVRRKITKD